MKLFNFLMVFPVSAACAERLFSKLKIAKIRLCDQSSQLTLESVLMNATKSSKQCLSKNTLEHFADNLKRNPRILTCYLTASRITLRDYPGGSLNHPMLITVFFTILNQRSPRVS